MTRVEDVDGAFVRSKRARGASWGAIARMAGVSETALRQRYAGAPKTYAPTPPGPREAAERALKAEGLDAQDARILARLYHANGAPISGREAAAGIAGGGLAYDLVTEARDRASRQLGLKFEACTRGFALKRESLKQIRNLIAAQAQREYFAGPDGGAP